MNENKEFCSILLQTAREDARKLNVKIPKLTTYKHSDLSSTPHYDVWSGKNLLWQGRAFNAADAKANCIQELIERANKGSALIS